MKVGDLVKIIYDGTLTIVTEVTANWIYVYDEEWAFKADKLELVNESR